MGPEVPSWIDVAIFERTGHGQRSLEPFAETLVEDAEEPPCRDVCTVTLRKLCRKLSEHLRPCWQLMLRPSMQSELWYFMGLVTLCQGGSFEGAPFALAAHSMGCQVMMEARDPHIEQSAAISEL